MTTIKVNNANIVPFVEELKDKLSEQLNPFLKVSKKLIESDIDKELLFYNTLFVSGEETPNIHHFALELDGNGIIDILGLYNSNTKDITSLSLSAVIPHHFDWIEGVKENNNLEFTKEQISMFIKYQNKFEEDLDKLGAYSFFNISEFNPEFDHIPESFINIEFFNKDIPFYKQDERVMESILKVVYNYYISMKSLFHSFNIKNNENYLFN